MSDEYHQPKTERLQSRISPEAMRQLVAIQEHHGGLSQGRALELAIATYHDTIADSPTKGSIIGGLRLTSVQEEGATCVNCNGEYQGGEIPQHALLIDDGKYCRVLAPVCAICAA